MRTWIEWLDQQWDKPNRSDHYLMQIAAEIARTRNPKHAGSIKLAQFKVPFKLVDAAGKEILTPEEIKRKQEQSTIQARSRWLGWLGAKLEDITKR